MRHDDQPVDLLVGIVGEREHRPIGIGFARAHLDAAHDAVRTGRGGDLDAVAVGLLHVGGGGEIDGRGIEPHVHGFDGKRGGRRQQRGGEREHGDKRAAVRDQSRTPGRSSASHAADPAPPTVKICKQIHPARFCFDIAPISRPWRPLRTCQEYRLRSRRARDRPRFQRVSTILPICALVSISAWAAAASLSGKVL